MLSTVKLLLENDEYHKLSFVNLKNEFSTDAAVRLQLYVYIVTLR